MNRNRVLCGDVLEQLRTLPDECVDCIFTSPPYWGLRDYGTEGQIGLEPNLAAFLGKMQAVTLELKRVLKPTGTLFWNHGDCYGGSWQDYGARNGGQRPKSTDSWQRPGNPSSEIPPTARMLAKSLAFQNYRLAIRMVDEQHWICRNANIWHKPNSMPSSVTDRFSNSYEPVFMFAKTNKAQFYVNQKTLLMQRKQPPGVKGEEGVDWEWRGDADNAEREGRGPNNPELANRNFMPINSHCRP